MSERAAGLAGMPVPGELALSPALRRVIYGRPPAPA